MKVLSDILRAVDGGDLALLFLLDLSAALDTVDHAILLRRLNESYGLGGCVHGWFVSYFNRHTQFVCHGASRSTSTVMVCGVPQWSVLGPILFLLYTADQLRLVETYGLHPHLFADDSQIYGYCRPDSTTQLQSGMSTCIDNVASCMIK